MTPPLLLASASPRRSRILHDLGLTFDVTVPEADEIFLEDAPEQTARQNAQRKHTWCRPLFPDYRIITADTIVAFEGRCVTKPDSLDQAREFLHAFSGKPQSVFTGVTLSVPGQEPETHVVASIVRFKPLTDDIITAYFNDVDPMDKAGAYDIDQRGDLIIDSHQGSYTNIMGLPAELIRSWLAHTT